MVDLLEGFPLGKVYTSDTTNPPTDAEIDALVGLTPAQVPIGYWFFVDDSNSDNTYVVTTNGTNWFYALMTKAA